MHGTGIFQVKENRVRNEVHDEVSLFKRPVNFIDYMKLLRAYEKKSPIMSDIWSKVIAGHVRHATRGELSADNAHPFQTKHLIGMHNGTLNGWRYWSKNQTDSELLFQDMENRGAEQVISELTPYDAFALVWYDTRTRLLYLTRNKERPFHFCVNEHRDVMYWASEKWMLDEILARNHVKIALETVFYTQPGVLYSVDPREIHRKDAGALLNSKVIEFKPPTYSRTNREDWFDQEWFEHKEKEKENRRLKVIEGGKDKKKKTQGKSGVPRIPQTLCVTCQRPMSLIDRYQGKHLKDDIYNCRDCEQDLFGNTQEEVRVG